MRLIDADALLELYADSKDFSIAMCNVPIPIIRQNILDMPTIDAVPVVHCRDCVYNGLDSMPHTKDKCYRLMLTCFKVKPEDFCVWGRKKDGE